MPNHDSEEQEVKEAIVSLNDGQFGDVEVKEVAGGNITKIKERSNKESLLFALSIISIIALVGLILLFLSFVLGRPVQVTGSERFLQATIETLQTSIAGTSQVQDTDATYLPLENISLSIRPYESIDESSIGQGTSYLTISTNTRETDAYTAYKLEYDLPNTGDAWAGFNLQFNNEVDVSEYRYLEFTLAFSNPTALVRLYLRDNADKQAFVMLGDGTVVTADTKEQLVRIPLDDMFSVVSKRSLRRLVFDVNNDFTQGEGFFVVKKIAFVH